MSDAAVVVIPARFGSTRFPGKMLACDTGKPLVQHVYERALAAKRVSRVIVATDDERILDAVRGFGGEVVLTGADHPNGTARVAEAVEALSISSSLIVNVQGDEPEIEPTIIDRAVEALEGGPDCVVSTLASPIADDDAADASNPNVVKVVCDLAGRALYFSRSEIPFDRDRSAPSARVLRHVGLYVYRPEFLRSYASLEPTPLETAERLEQLRILEHGYSIAVAVVESSHSGIDTPQQYAAFVQRRQRAGGVR